LDVGGVIRATKAKRDFVIDYPGSSEIGCAKRTSIWDKRFDVSNGYPSWRAYTPCALVGLSSCHLGVVVIARALCFDLFRICFAPPLKKRSMFFRIRLSPTFMLFANFLAVVFAPLFLPALVSCPLLLWRNSAAVPDAAFSSVDSKSA
jgi:hypothetical protein